MFDYDINRSQKRCSVTDRVFEPGETYISALFEADEGYTRKDFAKDKWEGPTDACIGWWQCKIPETNQERVYWAPDDVLIAYFENLLERQDHPNVLFVMGIVLVRRKILKMAPNETDEDNRQLMVLQTADRSKTYHVPIVEPSHQEIDRIQKELAEQLFTDQPPN